ncbi:MAG: hypothetical protein V4813_18270 [Gemmatimonadota bacterium]
MACRAEQNDGLLSDFIVVDEPDDPGVIIISLRTVAAVIGIGRCGTDLHTEAERIPSKPSSVVI